MGRLVGLDVARALALFGMVATHVLDPYRSGTGEITRTQEVAGGGSAALFAVLAGVSIALMTGRERPLAGTRWWRASAALLWRALLVAGVGLVLGMLDSGIAVILTYYGLLFVLAVPFLGLRARWLGLLAAVWVVLGPVVSHLLRPALPERRYANPAPDQLAEPGRLLAELAFTGYYPVVPWLAYLVAGLAVGRMVLGSRRVQLALVGAGLVLTAVPLLVSRRLLQDPGVQQALLDGPGVTETRFDALLDRIAAGMYGTTPPGGPWEWLLVAAPHSATPFDLAHTIGSSLLAIGVCLGVVGLLPQAGRHAVAVLFGAGTVTLSLYTLHVVMRTPLLWPADEQGVAMYGTHVLVLAGIGALLVLRGWRGPLEVLASRPARWLRGGRSEGRAAA